ncbi:MAG: VWA domain-containing protein [Myxococcales bacterium]|nr:VWA domain-containing protein [Myxococcales bacterium]
MTESKPRRRDLRVALLALLIGATTLVAHARASAPQPTSRTPGPGGAPRIEVAFVLDTTGSMAGLIEGAKREIWSIANQMVNAQPTPEIRMGLIGYRDRGDAYVTRAHDLSSDVDGVYAALRDFAAGGGGDTPESVNQALHEAITRMSWTESQDVYKVIFLVGDAPPHMEYAGDVAYAQSVRLARERDIIVNTIQCGDIAGTEPVWREIASGGAGRYAAIRADGGMQALATPLDEALGRLNRSLADTVIAWGDAGERAEIEDKRRLALEADAPAAASRLGFFAKLGGLVSSGRADLVDAVKQGLADVASLDEDALPATLRAMRPEEREDYVKRKLEARNEIQREIAQLSQQRDAWIEQEQSKRTAEGRGDGFDRQVLETIRAQAAAKGIAY